MDETLDDIVQEFVELIVDQQRNLWGLASLTLQFKKRFGSLKALASQIPRSEKTLQSYVHTIETFPDGAEFPDVDFSIFRICSYVPDPLEPADWLNKAMEAGWSTTQLRQEIKIALGQEDQEPCKYLAEYCHQMKKPIDKKEQCPDCQYWAGT